MDLVSDVWLKVELKKKKTEESKKKQFPPMFVFKRRRQSPQCFKKSGDLNMKDDITLHGKKHLEKNGYLVNTTSSDPKTLRKFSNDYLLCSWYNQL